MSGVALGCLLAIGLAAALPSGAQGMDREELRRSAVALGRQGEYQAGLEILRVLREADPEDAAVRHDTLMILGWAGRDEEALELARGAGLDGCPAYVLEAVARSARNLRRFDRAVALYRRARHRDPDRWQTRLGLAVSLVESGRPDPALREVLPLLERHPDRVEVLLGAAYIRRRRREHLQEIALYDRALRLEPDRPEVIRLRILAMADLGAVQPALELAAAHPEVLTEADRHRLEGDRNAQLVKWGELGFADPEDRFVETDRALALLEGSLDSLPPEAGGPRRRARLDRMIAWRDRLRMEEVVEEHRRLVVEEQILPPYALIAAGDAYLYLEQPEEAAELYRQAIELDPENFNARLSLFSALWEAGRYSAAVEEIDDLAAEQRAWRWAPRGDRLVENLPRLEADRTCAMARAYGNRLRTSQELLQELVRGAPSNGDLRLALASVLRWRGWPRRAREEYELVLALEPDLTGARIGLASTLLDLGELEEARDMIRALTGQYPDHKHVQSLQQTWDVRRRWELYLDTNGGRSRGPASDVPEQSGELFLYSSPLWMRCRPFLHARIEGSRWEDESLDRQRLGLGLETMLGSGWRFVGEVHRRLEEDAGPGLLIGLDGRLDDRWSLSARMDSRSTEVPLRAAREGIHGWSGDGAVRYRWSDLGSASLGASYLELSDGNRRTSVQADWMHRFYQGWRYRAAAGLELYLSENNLENAPYFNPTRDRSVGVSLLQEWEQFRTYRRALVHRLVLTGGSYWQEGFGEEGILSGRYEQDWVLTRAAWLRFGGSWSSRVYDGQREEQWQLHLTLGWRFAG